jgi:hypothetical protein
MDAELFHVQNKHRIQEQKLLRAERVMWTVKESEDESSEDEDIIDIEWSENRANPWTVNNRPPLQTATCCHYDDGDDWSSSCRPEINVNVIETIQLHEIALVVTT